MTEFKTPEANAKADVEQASAGAGAAGVGATTDMANATGQTGTVQTGFSETGHAQLSDTNVQELLSTATGLMGVSAATLKASLDSVAMSRATNAAILDNMAQLNANHLNNLVNSASHRHSELATDRQWNVNETDFYATVAAAVAAAMAPKA